MPEHSLTIPRLAVTLDTGEELEVQALNPDLIAYDRASSKHRDLFPPGQSAPFIWLTFIAWHALRREGRIPAELGVEEFMDGRAAQVRNLTPGTADPTLPGADPG